MTTTNEGTQRNELASEITGHHIGDGYYSAIVNMDEAREIADDILAAGYRKPRTITTVGELDALADGSVVREADGRVTEALESWNRDESSFSIQFLETGTSWRLESREIALPATILWEPKVEAGA